MKAMFIVMMLTGMVVGVTSILTLGGTLDGTFYCAVGDVLALGGFCGSCITD